MAVRVLTTIKNKNQLRAVLIYPSPLSKTSQSSSFSRAFPKTSLEVLFPPCLASLRYFQKHRRYQMDVSGNHPSLSLFSSHWKLPTVWMSWLLSDLNSTKLRSFWDLISDSSAIVSEELEGRYDSSTFAPTLKWTLEGWVNLMSVPTLFFNEAQSLHLLLTIQHQSLLGPIHYGPVGGCAGTPSYHKVTTLSARAKMCSDWVPGPLGTGEGLLPAGYCPMSFSS